jgi:hypothetical protein
VWSRIITRFLDFVLEVSGLAAVGKGNEIKVQLIWEAAHGSLSLFAIAVSVIEMGRFSVGFPSRYSRHRTTVCECEVFCGLQS